MSLQKSSTFYFVDGPRTYDHNVSGHTKRSTAPLTYLCVYSIDIATKYYMEFKNFQSHFVVFRSARGHDSTYHTRTLKSPKSFTRTCYLIIFQNDKYPVPVNDSTWNGRRRKCSRRFQHDVTGIFAFVMYNFPLQPSIPVHSSRSFHQMAKKCILVNRYLITFLHDLKILFTTNVCPWFLKINKIFLLGDVCVDWFFSFKSGASRPPQGLTRGFRGQGFRWYEVSWSHWLSHLITRTYMLDTPVYVNGFRLID